jgi:sugar lactone lactonase YvrE
VRGALAAALTLSALLAASGAAAPGGTLTARSPISTVPGGRFEADQLAVDAAGRLYAGYSDPDNGGYVYRFDAAGGKTLVVHVGSGVDGMAIDRKGDIFLSDGLDRVVREVTPGWVARIVAGILGRMGTSGNGGSATHAELDNPSGLAVDAAGDLFIGDDNTGQIRKVTPAGIISLYAGNNSLRGPVGNGVPAVDARIESPDYMAIGPDGALYVSDSGLGLVRRIDARTHVLTTVAGNGKAFSGDGGPAVKAGFGSDFENSADGIAFDRSGELWVSDVYRVRRIDSNGIVTTVAGIGDVGSSGDGGPAGAAGLSYPTDLAFGPDGSLYIGTGDGVRRIRPGVATHGTAIVAAQLLGTKPVTFGIAGTVTALSADGRLVAFDEMTGGFCDWIHFWNPVTRVTAKGEDRCIDDASGSQSDSAFLTLSGTTALWADFDQGNHSYCTSGSSSLAAPKIKDAGLCTGDPDDVIGGIAGQEGTFVVNHWTECSTGCPNGVDTYGGDRVSDVTLVRIAPDGAKTTIGTGKDALTVAAMDGGRLLLVRADDELAIVSSSGATLRTIPFQTARVYGAALQGNDVVVETSNQLIDFSASTGKKIAARGIPRNDDLSFGGVESGIAVWTLRRELVLERLRDGRTVTIQPGGLPVRATFSSAGLYYSYTASTHGENGHVAFVPLAVVLRAFR